jgi:hypothetical protein
MRFDTKPHPFYCGIDLHARSMYVCVLSHDGDIVLHRNMKAAPEPFLKAIAPYRDGLVAAVASNSISSTPPSTMMPTRSICCKPYPVREKS